MEEVRVKIMLWNFGIIMKIISALCYLVYLMGQVDGHKVQSYDNEYDNCNMSYTDALTQPWAAIVQVEENGTITSWPTIIISSTILLSNGKPFRGSNNKLRILEHGNYNITIINTPNEYKTNLEISYIQPHPLISNVTKYWMVAEYDLVLIHLEEEIQFSLGVRRLCLPNLDSSGKAISVETGDNIRFTGLRFDFDTGGTRFGQYRMYVKSFEECNYVWQIQAKSSLCEGEVEYSNRICSSFNIDSRSETVQMGFSLEDLGDSAVEFEEKCYFAIYYNERQLYREYTLVGMFNGGQDVLIASTIYTSLVTADIVKWVEDNQRCGSTQYTCGDGQCISLDFVCNQVKDCSDGTDESPVYCRARNYCPGDQFECGIYGACISRISSEGKEARNCDGIVDCPFGEDEAEPDCQLSSTTDLFFSTTSESEPSTPTSTGSATSVASTSEPPNEISSSATSVASSSEPPYETSSSSTTVISPSSSTTTQGPGLIERYWDYMAGAATFIVLVFVGLVFLQKIIKGDKYLSEEEILEFHQGLTENALDGEAKPPLGNSYNQSLQSPEFTYAKMPYLHHIKKDKFEFGLEIGSGAFGSVYNGYLNGAQVAIKVSKKDSFLSRSSRKQMFKAFLSELKILSYINLTKGGHPHIIRLIGAYTGEIRELVLFMAIEHCPFGSISDYFKKFKESDLYNNFGLPVLVQTEASCASCYVSEASCRPCPTAYQGNTSHLENIDKWVTQFLDALCFLTTHKIIHGDLAARNILLDAHLNTKLGDFGLARQIYYMNTSGVEINKYTELPWRWMGPEIITDMRISTKSEVWSFAVTVWELYSIGSLPYGGLHWNPAFIDQLRQGLRLTKPELSSECMFNVLKDCWKFNPNDRPDFEMLKGRIHLILDLKGC